MSYATTVVLWRDPVTDLYARWQQRNVEAALTKSFRTYRASERLGGGGARDVAAAAKEMQAGLELGKPLGYVIIPKLDVTTAFVHGTRWREDLTRGAGHYAETSLPGRGATVGIAGHRTSFGAPFRRIDDLRRGDVIDVTVAYAAFRYRVFAHEVVDADDWSILRPRGFETLVLSACHPLYSAARRWIVYARLVKVQPSGGRAYTPAQLVGGRTTDAGARSTAAT